MSECTCHKNYTLDTLIPKVGVITKITQETPDVKTFCVTAPGGGKLFEHMPGQCAMVCVPGIGEAMFSITSSPTNKEYQEFSIKKCGVLTDCLHSLEVGDEITVRGPYGNNFPVDTELKGKNLLFIAGGIGLAAQINNMTNDFLCATLRNAANVAGKPLLMISSNPIDSAKSGSIDMAANGMPFYADNLMAEIRKMADESTQLSPLEKRILDFELKRRDSDVFSDKASLYEYRDLLSIMSSGSIEKENYPGFRLFPVDGKKDYQNEGKTQIDKKIKENHDLFEKIDRSIRFGNVEADLAEDFEDGFLMRIEKSRKEDPEHWSVLFTYAEMIAAMEKKQAKKDNPPEVT